MSESDNSGLVALWITVMLFQLILPTAIYGFTEGLVSFGDNPEDWDISLDYDELIEAEIFLGEGESNNISYGGTWVYYEILNRTIRTRWYNDAIYGDILNFQQQGILARFLDSWAFNIRDVGVKTSNNRILGYYITNSTIVSYHDYNRNWTRFILVGTGYNVFIQPQFHIADNNITSAVYTYGNVTLTMAEQINTDESINLRSFISWYIGIITGDNNYGMPYYLSWLMRILTAMTVVSSILMVKHISPI